MGRLPKCGHRGYDFSWRRYCWRVRCLVFVVSLDLALEEYVVVLNCLSVLWVLRPVSSSSRSINAHFLFFICISFILAYVGKAQANGKHSINNYFDNLLCKMFFTQNELNSNKICVILMHKLNFNFFYRPKISNPKNKSQF